MTPRDRSTVHLFGFFCCNKPCGMTSRDVVNVIQRRIRSELGRRDIKVGHAGTLDPLASGVLVVGLGPASRLVPYVQQQSKHYRAHFRLGESTISGDLEGEVTSHPDLPPPSDQQIRDCAAGLVGRIEQVPPAHSAIWVDGKRAYKRIRAGESFEMPSRMVQVDAIDVLHYAYPDLELDIVCGSGTYIRSIGIDLAAAAGSVAVMTDLKRTAVGPFSIDQAHSIDHLRNSDLASMLLPPTLAVEHLDQITIDDQDSQRLGHGKSILDSVSPNSTREKQTLEDQAAAITSDGHLRAILKRKSSGWHPYRVFPV